MNQFYDDILKGLQSKPKYLPSKYFYDEKGDALFQKLMCCDEYYLTRCEMEIFTDQHTYMADAILENQPKWDVIEFGPGDAIKSKFLLCELVKRDAVVTYFPIDISENIIRTLTETFTETNPDLAVYGLNGEYLEMLKKVNETSTSPKLVLFLGANIGNFSVLEMKVFCKELASQLAPGDLLMIGFDLKKNPFKILSAYNDESKITKDFNLNLLQRINKEFEANFQLNQFEHYPTYDPQTGCCKSFLISLSNQTVCLGNDVYIHFLKDEPIFMEISQKYELDELEKIAEECGFIPLMNFMDQQEYFVDALWQCRSSELEEQEEN